MMPQNLLTTHIDEVGKQPGAKKIKIAVGTPIVYRSSIPNDQEEEKSEPKRGQLYSQGATQETRNLTSQNQKVVPSKKKKQANNSVQKYVAKGNQKQTQESSRSVISYGSGSQVDESLELDFQQDQKSQEGFPKSWRQPTEAMKTTTNQLVADLINLEPQYLELDPKLLIQNGELTEAQVQLLYEIQFKILKFTLSSGELDSSTALKTLLQAQSARLKTNCSQILPSSQQVQAQQIQSAQSKNLNQSDNSESNLRIKLYEDTLVSLQNSKIRISQNADKNQVEYQSRQARLTERVVINLIAKRPFILQWDPRGFDLCDYSLPPGYQKQIQEKINELIKSVGANEKRVNRLILNTLLHKACLEAQKVSHQGETDDRIPDSDLSMPQNLNQSAVEDIQSSQSEESNSDQDSQDVPDSGSINDSIVSFSSAQPDNAKQMKRVKKGEIKQLKKEYTKLCVEMLIANQPSILKRVPVLCQSRQRLCHQNMQLKQEIKQIFESIGLSWQCLSKATMLKVLQKASAEAQDLPLGDKLKKLITSSPKTLQELDAVAIQDIESLQPEEQTSIQSSSQDCDSIRSFTAAEIAFLKQKQKEIREKTALAKLNSNQQKKEKSNDKEEYTKSSLELCFPDLPSNVLSNPNVFIENSKNHSAQIQLKNRIKKIFEKKDVQWSKINKGLLLQLLHKASLRVSVGEKPQKVIEPQDLVVLKKSVQMDTSIEDQLSVQSELSDEPQTSLVLQQLSEIVETQHQAALIRFAALDLLKSNQLQSMKFDKLYEQILLKRECWPETVAQPSVSQFQEALSYFYERKIFFRIKSTEDEPDQVGFDSTCMSDQTFQIVFNYKVKDGQVVKKAPYEQENDYIVTPIQNMQEYSRSAIQADYDFTPEDQENLQSFMQLVITGELLEKFTDEELVFPELPKTFYSAREYKKFWLYLIQYEIFCKLLSRSSNKRQRVNLEDDEIEKNELIQTTQKLAQGKLKAPTVWVCYCRLKAADSAKRQQKKKGKDKMQQQQQSLILKMYRTPPSEEKTTELDVDDQLVTRKERIEFCPEDREILAADAKFNTNFELKQVRQHDLLLISSVDLGLGKDLKDKVKTIDQLKQLIELEDTALAFVLDGLKSTSFDKEDKKSHILIEVHQTKRDFIEQQLATSLSRFYVYTICGLAQDIKQYLAVLNSNRLNISSKLLVPSQNLSVIKLDPDFRLPGNMQAHAGNYNYSQKAIFQQVAAARAKDVILIQGPPGTGKTETITGIVAMLLQLKNNYCRVQVCAPSNCAVDEILTRVKDRGLVGLTSEVEELKKLVVRVGAPEYVPNDHIKDFTLQARCQKIAGDEKIQKLKQHLGFVKQLQVLIEKELLEYQYLPQEESETKEKKKEAKKAKQSQISQKKQLIPGKEIIPEHMAIFRIVWQDSVVEEEDFLYYDDDVQLKKLDKLTQRILNEIEGIKNGTKKVPIPNLKILERDVLDKSQVLLTTLMTGASGKLRDCLQAGVDYLIIDEACQSIEPMCLVPMTWNPQVVILVGDHRQLPATTFSPNASSTQFERSMFERFVDAGMQKHMLEVQYRMFPSIRKFPSDAFYEGKINDGESVLTRELDQAMNNLAAHFSRVVFFDIRSSVEKQLDLSRVNITEANFTFQLIQTLIKLSGNKSLQTLKKRIGLVTPYKGQVRFLRTKLEEYMYLFDCKKDDMNINSVDAYQGQEKDIIIFNCVRANYFRNAPISARLGFLTDLRRLNVAITRPKHFLFIVGNSDTLSLSKTWSQMIESYKHNYCSYVEVPNSPIYSPELIQSCLMKAKVASQLSK